MLELIERKAAGKAIAVQPEPEEVAAPAPDLMSALKASLDAVRAREDAAEGADSGAKPRKAAKKAAAKKTAAKKAAAKPTAAAKKPTPSGRRGRSAGWRRRARGPSCIGASTRRPRSRSRSLYSDGYTANEEGQRPAGPQADGQDSPRCPPESYRAKRDFAATPEPAVAEVRTAVGTVERRFVIHEHHATRLHWDLRLERDGALASWAIPKGLPQAPGENHLAVAVEDHPLEYLDFEAEIPKGQYGAGLVTIWDRGTYDCLKWEPRKVEVALHGERVNARYALFPIDQGQHPKNWLIHRMDPATDPDREPLPSKLVPMLARAGSLPAHDSDWAFEIKWDGVRAIAYSEPGELRLESRNLNDITDSYPEIFGVNAALGSHSAVLDGELVAFDASARPSFEALQRRMHTASRAQARRLAKGTPVTYVIFDLLWLDGHSLMREPYSERRAQLAALALNGERWQTPDHVVGHGAQLLAASAEQQLEGVVAKRLSSTYEPGVRSREWLKVKTHARQELVVGGWMAGKGKRRQSIGALLLGVYEPGGVLRYAGRVGSGFDEQELRLLSGCSRRWSGPRRRSAPARNPHAGRTSASRGWSWRSSSRAGRAPAACATPCTRACARTSPRRRSSARTYPRPSRTHASIERDAADRTDAEGEALGTLSIRRRGASAADTTIEGRELKLSNLDKVLYPATGFTKGEVIAYYATVAPVLLGHLGQRALTVKRWPDGVEGKSFFQKQAPAHRPGWVRTVTVAAERKSIDYVLADDLATLVWLANLAAIELHVPLARAPAIERPTAVVFDLDPGAPASIVECCQVAAAAAGHVRAPRPGELREDVRLEGVAGVHTAEHARRRLRANKAVREGGRRAARELPT